MKAELIDLLIINCKSSPNKIIVTDDVVNNYSIPVDVHSVDSNFNDVENIRCCLTALNYITIINEVELYNISDMPEVPKSQILYISSSDIIDNRITLNHQLNTSTLDCSIFDENGVEISVGFKLQDSNTVILDMQRVTIPNGLNWKVLLEV